MVRRRPHAADGDATRSTLSHTGTGSAHVASISVSSSRQSARRLPGAPRSTVASPQTRYTRTTGRPEPSWVNVDVLRFGCWSFLGLAGATLRHTM